MLTPVDQINLRGGRLCLDFVNTSNWLDDDPTDERLTDMGAVEVWARRVGFRIGAPLGGTIENLRLLRTAVRNLLPPVGQATAADVDRVGAARRAAPPGLTLTQTGAIVVDLCSGEALARAIADSAAELFLFADKHRIKMCPADRCGWIFLDESPNNSRTWCSMSTCGNREKARNFQARKRKGAKDAPSRP